MEFIEYDGVPTKTTISNSRRGPLPKVCDLCKIRKRKCNLAKPKCFECRENNLPCTFKRYGFEEKRLVKKDSNEARKVGSSYFINKKPGNVLNFNSNSTSSISLDSSNTNNNEKVNNRNILKMISFRRNSAMKLYMNEANFIKRIINSSVLANVNSKTYLHVDGQAYYYGPSLATYYFTCNSKLLKDTSTSFDFKALPPPENINLNISLHNRLKLQLTELYFAYLNTFYPLIYPSYFFSKLNKKTHSITFQALHDAVCLVGSNYYPNRAVGRELSQYFSASLFKKLKHIYLKPSLTVIQTLTLACYHSNLSEQDPLIYRSWNLLGTAHRMCLSLGFHLPNRRRSLTLSKVITRTWWVLAVCEVAHSYCFGRPYTFNAFMEEKAPTVDKVIGPSVSFGLPEILKVKLAAEISVEASASYFSKCCSIFTVMFKYCRATAIFKLSSINGSRKESCKIYHKSCEELERDVYMLLDETKESCGNLSYARSSDNGQIDLKTLNLHFFCLSLLIDLNKPFINFEGFSPLLEIEPKVEHLAHLNPVQKCVVAAQLSYQIVMNHTDLFLEPSIPVHWYAILQTLFIHLVMVGRYKSDTNAKNIQRVRDLVNVLELSAERWVIIRDIYSVASQVVNRILKNATC